MTSNFTTPSRTALLIMHVQPPLTSMPGGDELLKRISHAASVARKSGVEVMYVNIGYRPGYPELAADDPVRQVLVPRNLLVEGISNAVHEAVAPQNGEIQFTATASSAFVGCDLERILKLKDINHVVLTGIATSGVVMGTVTEADDRNYKVTVLSDGVLDSNRELHQALLALFPKPPRRARVITTAEWASECGDGRVR